MFERTSFWLPASAEGGQSATAMAAKQTSEESASEKLNEARKRNLDLAIAHIQKEFGESAIIRLGDDRCVDVDVIPTGNLLIDRALGVGGFPCGRIVEVFGPESSGKTTLTLTVIAQAQKRGASFTKSSPSPAWRGPTSCTM